MTRSILPCVCAILAIAPAAAQMPQTETQAEVLKAEEAFNQAKIHNNLAALDQILAPEYMGINQWGLIRNRQAALDLFREFPTSSLIPTHVTVTLGDGTAIIHGAMSESNQWKFLFMRTYVKRQGRWLLVSSVQTIPIGDNNQVADPEISFAPRPN